MACSGQHEQRAKLDRIDSLMNDHPDSALTMLDSLKAEKANWSKSLRMRFDLLEAKAQNKADVLFTSDSIAKDFTKYYDRHGSTNERMLAHYLLGCVYRDKGDSPRAIDCYLDAITKADTLAKDCDFNTMFRVFSQMARIYHKQLLLTKEIEARYFSSHFAFLAKDTLSAIQSLNKLAGAYILLNKKDSAEYLIKKTRNLCLHNHYIQDALQTSLVLLYMYVQEPNRLSEAKQLINEYEEKSTFFDEHHELPSSRRIFYFYKGKYYEGIHQLDSAEYYYRKVYHTNMSFTEQNSMYRGLLSIYKKRHLADSIAKYAQLYCEVNDSSIAKKDQQLTAQMAASYNYSLYQKEALENESKANIARLILVSLIFLVILSSIIFLMWYQKIKQKKQEEIESLKAEHIRATDEYSRNIYTMRLLDKARQQDIELMQKDYDEYESKMMELKEENRRLKKAIKHIEHQKGISHFLENTTEFLKTGIVRYLKELEKKPLSVVEERDWTKLDDEMRTYFPIMLLDLQNTPKITKQKKQVCLLVILRISDSCIANWLNLKPNRISNIKLELNETLFGDSSARTLYTNLSQKYNIISGGE